VKTRLILRSSSGARDVPVRGLSRRELRRIGRRNWRGIRTALIVGALLMALMIAGLVRRHDTEMLQRRFETLPGFPAIRHSH